MELKVWVDGVQRVVCGITEQTNVQEVVIALAQATGRTGRYTLVEKWKTSEKMLPPAEHPLQVLSNWGEKAGEVQFVLRRTGASSSMSGDDKVVIPERKNHRSSLPPQFKHKQKKEAFLNRKEPKRKSLDITGGTSNEASMKNYKLVPTAVRHDENKSDKSLPASPKKALIPSAFLNQAASSQKLYPMKPEVTAKQNQPSVSSHQPDIQPLSPKKKALMPPGLKRDQKLLDEHRGEVGGPVPRSDRATSGESDKFVPAARRLYEQHNNKTVSQPKPLETIKARTEFTRLVLEQHEHVNEQMQTIEALDNELEKLEVLAQRKEESAAMLQQKEIERLEETLQKNDQDIANEKSLQELLQHEDYQRSSLQNKNNKYQSDISSVSENVKEMEKQMFLLQQEIEREKSLQARKVEEKFKTRYRSAESEVRKTNTTISSLLDQLKEVDDNINHLETAFHDKEVQLEALNRELRQVNLQQFIRQTGSKVTVLPPNADKSTTDVDSAAYDEVKEAPSGGADASGVWV